MTVKLPFPKSPEERADVDGLVGKLNQAYGLSYAQGVRNGWDVNTNYDWSRRRDANHEEGLQDAQMTAAVRLTRMLSEKGGAVTSCGKAERMDNKMPCLRFRSDNPECQKHRLFNLAANNDVMGCEESMAWIEKECLTHGFSLGECAPKDLTR